jgi:hypothetical protein
MKLHTTELTWSSVCLSVCLSVYESKAMLTTDKGQSRDADYTAEFEHAQSSNIRGCVHGLLLGTYWYKFFAQRATKKGTFTAVSGNSWARVFCLYSDSVPHWERTEAPDMRWSPGFVNPLAVVGHGIAESVKNTNSTSTKEIGNCNATATSKKRHRLQAGNWFPD